MTNESERTGANPDHWEDLEPEQKIRRKGRFGEPGEPASYEEALAAAIEAARPRYQHPAQPPRDPALPVADAATLLETQMAQCVDLIHELAQIAGHRDLDYQERLHLLDRIGGLLESSASVGKVVGRLRNGPEETRHTVVVERGEKRGKGVRKS